MTDKSSTVARGVAGMLLLTACLLPTRGFGDVAAMVDSVERLLRTGRLAAAGGPTNQLSPHRWTASSELAGTPSSKRRGGWHFKHR